MADSDTPTTPAKTTGTGKTTSASRTSPMKDAVSSKSPAMTSPSPVTSSSPTAAATFTERDKSQPSTRDHLANAKDSAVTRVKDEATRGKEQALATAASYADQGKGKAAGALTTLSGLIVEAAKMLEENFGHKAADPVRASADRVSGAARHLETADVDQLTAELKTFAKNNPVLSVGAVAVVGFALGKLLSGGGSDD